MRIPTVLLVSLALAFVAGCGSEEEDSPVTEPIDVSAPEESVESPSESPPTSPEQSAEAELETQLRMGAVQLNAAAASTREAYTQVSVAASESEDMVAEASDEISFFLDSAGSSLSEASGMAPESVTPETLSEAGEVREQMIRAAEDARFDLQNAYGIAESLSEGGPGSASFSNLANVILIAIEDLDEALETLGVENDPGLSRASAGSPS